MLFHYFLLLKFVNNFEISCQDNEFILKVELTPENSVLLMRADDYLINIILCQKVNLEKIYIIEQSNSELRVNFMNRTIVKWPLQYR